MIYFPQDLLQRELFGSNVSLSLGDLSRKRDVWNLMVDTADPSNFDVRFGLVQNAIEQTDDDDSQPGVQGIPIGFDQKGQFAFCYDLMYNNVF